MKSIYTLSQTPIIITDLDGTILVDGKLENEVINKTVWFYEMEVIKAFDKEPDNEIDELAVLGYEDALKLLTFEEDKKILKYVFNK